MKTFAITAGILILIVLYFSYIGIIPKFINFGGENAEERVEKLSLTQQLRIEQKQKLADQQAQQRRLMEDRQRKMREYRDRH